MPNPEMKFPEPKMGPIRKLAQLVQGQSDRMYRDIFYNDPTNRQQLQNIKGDITRTIKDIMDSSTDSVGEPNISKLYERILLNTQKDKNTITEFERIFGDNEFVSNLTASYLDNRWVKAVDEEIDQILKYMPKLQEALDTLTDNVLSADSFNKDFLNISNSIQDASTSDEQFDRNIQDLKKNYELPKLIKRIYRDTAKYGETFVYRVPYQKAIQRLMDRKNINQGVTIRANYNNESYIMIESAGTDDVKIPISKYIGERPFNGNYRVTYEEGIITSLVNQYHNTEQALISVNEQSMFHENIVDITNAAKSYAYDDTMNVDAKVADGKLPKHRRFDKTLGDDLILPNFRDTSSDGLYERDKKPGKLSPMNGCIVKILKRERVVPIILNQICLGYYYFEFDSNIELFDERLTSTGLVNTLTGISRISKENKYKIC